MFFTEPLTLHKRPSSYSSWFFLSWNILHVGLDVDVLVELFTHRVKHFHLHWFCCTRTPALWQRNVHTSCSTGVFHKRLVLQICCYKVKLFPFCLFLWSKVCTGCFILKTRSPWQVFLVNLQTASISLCCLNPTSVILRSLTVTWLVSSWDLNQQPSTLSQTVRVNQTKQKTGDTDELH